MKDQAASIKNSFKKYYKFAGLIHIYTRTCNMLYDKKRIDVLDFAYDILIFVESIADLMQYDDMCRGCDIEICEQLSKMAGNRAAEVMELIDNINGYPPFPSNSLRDFLREYKKMDAHIQSIQNE